MKSRADVLKFAIENGYDGCDKDLPWRGYEVYSPIVNEFAYIGLPLVILVKGDDIRLSTDSECFAYRHEAHPEIYAGN